LATFGPSLLLSFRHAMFRTNLTVSHCGRLVFRELDPRRETEGAN
jgi:hypothetical protein